MTGGLIQLVTTGIQDSPIIGSPEITFFKTVYRQHTHFSICHNERYIGSYEFGKSSSRVIEKNGDLLYIQINPTALANVVAQRGKGYGNIIYVNKRFEEVSEWRLREIKGKTLNVVSSGEHSKMFWKDMFRTTIKEKKIWHEVVTNKNKNGDLYYVDSYIKADFDEDGKLSGFMSIRYDVSEIVKSTQEIEKKNTYLEHAAKILRHDMHSVSYTHLTLPTNREV